MTAGVLQTRNPENPSTAGTRNAIDDRIGTRKNKIYADASMADFPLVATYKTTLATAAEPTSTVPTHLMLYFQKQ